MEERGEREREREGGRGGGREGGREREREREVPVSELNIPSMIPSSSQFRLALVSFSFLSSAFLRRKSSCFCSSSSPADHVVVM